jgi:hypothetical protein
VFAKHVERRQDPSIPPEVLADYPDLAPPAQAPAQRPTGEKPQAPVQPQPAVGAKAALPELHPDVHPSIVQDAWNTVAAEQPELAKQVKRILPLDNYKYPTANASYAPESGTLRVNVDKPLTPETLRHEFEHVAQAQRGEAKFREDFPSEEEFQAAVEKPAREAGKKASMSLPDLRAAAKEKGLSWRSSKARLIELLSDPTRAALERWQSAAPAVGSPEEMDQFFYGTQGEVLPQGYEFGRGLKGVSAGLRSTTGYRGEPAKLEAKRQKEGYVSGAIGHERTDYELQQDGKNPPEHTTTVVEGMVTASPQHLAASKGAPRLKEFVRTVPEFALDPNFTVVGKAENRQLQFQDGGKYKFFPKSVGIVLGDGVSEGERVGIDVEAVKKLKQGNVLVVKPNAEKQSAPATAKAASPNPLRPRGAVPLPQILEAARAGVRGIRERFAEIEHRYGSDLANKFARATTPNTEAESIIRFWEKNGGDPATLQKLRDLGEHLRAEQDIKLKGLPATGLKTLTPAQEVAIRADPKVQQAMKWWNTNVRPLINDIRTTHGLPMSKAGNLIDFFVNLPSEYGPANVAGGKTGTNLREAFTRAATGEGQYIADPREFFKSMLGYHLRTDATKQLIAAVKRDAVVPTGSVRVPTGSAGNPATFPKLPQGQFFQATIKGRVEDVMPVDLAKPGDPADYAYVPKRVGETLRNLRQPVMQGDTIIDKAMNAATTVGVTGSFAPHTVRMLLHSGTRMAESGQSVMAAVPWVGKAVAAYQRSGQMRDQQFGKAVQLLIDRTGADKGWGYGVKPPTTTVGKILKAAHEKLFNPETGIDPMNRRVVADSYLRLVLGNDRLNQLEKSVNAGRMSPIEASRQIEAALGPKDLQGMARYVNGTIGWSNAQTRSSWLNWASRAFPFVSSESGKIPREIAHVATAGINPAAIVRHLQAGRYGAAAGAATAMLAGGAAGTYALMNAINYANTKAQTGTGKFMWDNDRHHKFDVFIAPNWYLSNFDPMLARGARLLGVKEAANEGTAAAAGKGAALENINEVFTVLNSGLKLLFSGVSAAALDQPRELRLDDRGRLVKASASDFSPTSIGRNTISYLRRQITGRAGRIRGGGGGARRRCAGGG